MITWKDKYSMGISRIDDEHKKFIDIINKAIVTKEHNNNPEELKEVLHEITIFAVSHFSTEETFMIEFNYAEYHSHKKEHILFSNTIIEFFNKIIDGDYQIADKIVECLKQWLINHILLTDKKYVGCFKENGLHLLHNHKLPIILTKV